MIRKSVAKCATHTQEILEIYTSVRKAALENNVDHKNLGNILKKEKPIAYGYYWMYVAPHKRCKCCKTIKHIEEFELKQWKTLRRDTICIKCNKTRSK